jgi:hypothetical protein
LREAVREPGSYLAQEDAGYDPAGSPDKELAVLGRLDDDWLLQQHQRRPAGGSDGHGATPRKSNANQPRLEKAGSRGHNRARPCTRERFLHLGTEVR